ncbi:hypothetical protein K1719_021688 [Acacia pycnantha]|nr:hypothetical protein K1719_021688 [Acacia pycnantha]
MSFAFPLVSHSATKLDPMKERYPRKFRPPFFCSCHLGFHILLLLIPPPDPEKELAPAVFEKNHGEPIELWFGIHDGLCPKSSTQPFADSHFTRPFSAALVSQPQSDPPPSSQPLSSLSPTLLRPPSRSSLKSQLCVPFRLAAADRETVSSSPPSSCAFFDLRLLVLQLKFLQLSFSPLLWFLSLQASLSIRAFLLATGKKSFFRTLLLSPDSIFPPKKKNLNENQPESC